MSEAALVLEPNLTHNLQLGIKLYKTAIFSSDYLLHLRAGNVSVVRGSKSPEGAPMKVQVIGLGFF